MMLLRRMPAMSLVIAGLISVLSGCKSVDDNSNKSAAAVAVESSFSALKSVFSQGQASKGSPSQSSESRAGQSAGAPHSSTTSVSSVLASDPESAELAKGPFAGITITEPDPSAGGTVRSSIVVYVSPEGNYATGGLDGNGYPCISWVTGSKTNPADLAFGFEDPATTQLYKNAGANVCPPFRVQFESDGMVRVISGSYNRKRNVVVRVPLKLPDWSLDIFERHAIKGIRLGPAISGVKKAVPFEPRALNDGAFLQFGLPDPSASSKQGYPKTIYGWASPREVSGWSTDILMASWYGGDLDQRGQGALFNKAVVEKYGSPSTVSQGYAFWFYDVEGRQLQFKDASSHNCLGNYQDWERNFMLGGSLGAVDLGPWGCSLMVKHTYADDSAVIGSYEVRTYSGLALGMAHFRARLGEVRRAKEKIGSLPQFKPKL